MKKIAVIFVFMAFLSCSRDRFEDADAFIRGLTPQQKVGQLMIFAVPGQKLNRQNSSLIKKYMPGGVVYFGYNMAGSTQVREFTSSLQELSFSTCGIPLFVSTDQEGGRVVRLKEGMTLFPGNLASAVAGDEEDVEKMALITGLELRSGGINMNLAPDLDVNNNPDNPVINTRSFGSNPEIVAQMGESYIKGLEESGCISVAKHFPGHGDTAADSHYTLPVIKHGMDRLKKVELVPFVRAVSAGVECIMTAHIQFPEIIPENESATISPFFLTRVLRNDMKFRGIAMTDDMEMNAVSLKMDLGTAALKSFLAGTDMILVSSYGKNIPLIYDTLLAAVGDGRISQERLDSSVRRIIEMKLRYGILSYDRETGKTGMPQFTPDEKQNKILEQGDSLNSRISSRAIRFTGKGSLHGTEPSSAIYISRNRTFRKNISLKKDDVLLAGAGSLMAALKRRTGKGRVRVVYQAYRINRKYMERLSERAEQNGGRLMILYTGNPFLLAGWETDIPVLFTFSHTEESMKQAARCLNGEFEPEKIINCNIGFGKSE